jgi:hypothetical protein
MVGLRQSVEPLSSLVKSNACLGFRVRGTPARTSRLKLNPLLVAYARGFITAVEVCESSATISANRRFSDLCQDLQAKQLNMRIIDCSCCAIMEVGPAHRLIP